MKNTSWNLEGNRFSATEKRKWQAWRADRDIQGKSVRKKQQVAQSIVANRGIEWGNSLPFEV